MTFTFNKPIQTPKGSAIFIGYLDGGRVQVSRHVRASEFSKEECIHRKPALTELPQIEFINWQKSAEFCINEIYVIEEVHEPDRQLELI